MEPSSKWSQSWGKRSISVVWMGHGIGLTHRPVLGILDYHNQLPRVLCVWWYPSPTERNGEGDICYLSQDTEINLPGKQKRIRLPQSPGTEYYSRGQWFPGTGHSLWYLQTLRRGVLLGVTLQGNWKYGKHGSPEHIIVTTWRRLDHIKREWSQWKPRWETNMGWAPWWPCWKP